MSVMIDSRAWRYCHVPSVPQGGWEVLGVYPNGVGAGGLLALGVAQ